MKYICIVLAFYTEAWAQGAYYQSIGKQELWQHGKKIYTQRCAGCHGEKGDGMGPGALFLDPKPRDFTQGVYKFSSRPMGAVPTYQDLLKTLNQGIVGTSMPAFPLLSQNSKMGVIEYIKSFAPKAWSKPEAFQAQVRGAAFQREDFIDYKKFIARANKGRGMYIESCAVCHGKTGLGDGDGAEGLEDDWGKPIKPANLTHPYIKRGRSIEDIYQTLLVGVNGTPMLSFKDTYTDEQLWDLAAYVFQFRGNYSPEVIKPITSKELE